MTMWTLVVVVRRPDRVLQSVCDGLIRAVKSLTVSRKKHGWLVLVVMCGSLRLEEGRAEV